MASASFPDALIRYPAAQSLQPLLNAQGHVLFQAQTAHTPSGPFQTGDIGWGLWTGLPGHLSLVAHVGLPSRVCRPRFRRRPGRIQWCVYQRNGDECAGQVAFEATLSNGQQGIWATDSSGLLTKIIVTGSQLPGCRRRHACRQFADFSRRQRRLGWVRQWLE